MTAALVEHADSLAGLEGFIRPASIRLVGRMDGASRPLGKMATYLRRHGFTGVIQQVGDRVDAALLRTLGIQQVGLDDGSPADLVVVAVRAELVPETIRRLGAIGHQRAIVLSSGFGEIGNSALEQELVRTARSAGMRLLGPNCQGIWNRNAGFAATFSEYLQLAEPSVSGRVAVVSQSGAVGYCVAGMLDRAGAPVALVASTGNEADVQWHDLVALVSRETGVDTVLAYLEQIRSIERLIEAAETARANGARLAVLKGGRTRQGNQAAASHTAAVASDGVLLEQVCYDLGIAYARDLPDLVAVATMSPRPAARRRIAVVTTSGGAGVIAADLFGEHGTRIPELSAPTRQRLTTLLGPYAATRNPVDVTAASAEDTSLIPKAWAAIMASGEIDDVVIVVTMVTGARMLATVEELIEQIAAQPHVAPPVVILLAPPAVRAEAMARLQAARIPTLESLTPVANASAGYRPGDPLVPTSARPAGGPVGGQPADDEPAADPALVVPDVEVLADFAARGLPVVARAELDLADLDAARVAAAVPGPYVVKLVTADVHKTAVGHVDVGPYTDSQVADAARALIGGRFGERPPRVQVQQYVHPALEVFLGVRRDPVFGVMLTLGIGGRLAEPLRAMRHARVPIDPPTLAERLADSLLGDLLATFGPGTVGRVARLAVDVADYFVARGDLAELDVNPIVVTTAGALILIDGAGMRSRASAAVRQEG